MDDLVDVFVDAPPRKYLHIVVKPPAGQSWSSQIPCQALITIHPVPPPSLPAVPIFELNCFLHGDDPHNVFPVKIARTESVGTLKKAIKEEKKVKFEHIDADALRLQGVSIPVDDGFKENVGKVELRDEEMLSPVDRLSTIFAVQPEDKHLHIIVHSPSVSKCIGQGA
jgi:hypothetical protein